MGRHREAEDRDSTIVNLETYRRQREMADHDANADQRPRDPDRERAAGRKAPVEGNGEDQG